MKFKAHIQTMYKPEIPDAHGTSLRNGLRGLGFEGVLDVRTGKEIELEVEAPDLENATQIIDQMCKSLLAHPVSESYTFQIEPTEKSVPTTEPEISVETVEEEVSSPEPEIKLTMMEKMLYMIDHKDNTDSDCFILANMIIKAQENGQFSEWLNEETNLDIIERWQRVTPKLFGRANKYLFTKKETEVK